MKRHSLQIIRKSITDVYYKLKNIDTQNNISVKLKDFFEGKCKNEKLSTIHINELIQVVEYFNEKCIKGNGLSFTYNNDFLIVNALFCNFISYVYSYKVEMYKKKFLFIEKRIFAKNLIKAEKKRKRSINTTVNNFIKDFSGDQNDKDFNDFFDKDCSLENSTIKNTFLEIEKLRNNAKKELINTVEYLEDVFIGNTNDNEVNNNLNYNNILNTKNKFDKTTLIECDYLNGYKTHNKYKNHKKSDDLLSNKIKYTYKNSKNIKLNSFINSNYLIGLVINVINKEFVKENKKLSEVSVLRDSTNSDQIISTKKAFNKNITKKEEAMSISFDANETFEKEKEHRLINAQWFYGILLKANQGKITVIQNEPYGNIYIK
ncbi:hypothetical protein EHP00_1491 [Ecytonucleospora hepatopenaei]|uniref:Uncharacterized protein n=1 Tax=Ecytonucleospora hepatopenaei TaxID=646526 RepID=A0A1W0E8S7_9MICR|nr:hypothetical protein EHP00_1491 [Ecytonucleospora hepatopenaei]